jgi:hypothetical protein
VFPSAGMEIPSRKPGAADENHGQQKPDRQDRRPETPSPGCGQQKTGAPFWLAGETNSDGNSE